MHILSVLTATSVRDQGPRVWWGGKVGGVGGRRDRGGWLASSSRALKSQASKVPGGADSHIMVFRLSLSSASATRRGKKSLLGDQNRFNRNVFFFSSLIFFYFFLLRLKRSKCNGLPSQRDG